MASAAEQLAKNLNFATFAKAKALQQRIWFTIGALIVYRLGTYIPVPGIDPQAYAQTFNSASKGIFGMFDLLSGGAVHRMANDGDRGEVFDVPASCQELPKHDSHRIDIRAAIHGGAARLLGRHVRELAFDDPCFRRGARRDRGFRDPEVDEFDHAVVGQKDVGRAQISMHDSKRRAVEVSELVHIVQARKRVGCNARRDARGERLGDARDGRERLTMQVLHHDVRAISALADLIRVHHIGVIEQRGEPPFFEEHLR